MGTRKDNQEHQAKAPVKKTVGSLDWTSSSGQPLVAFCAVDSWHYADDPLWQIAELEQLHAHEHSDPQLIRHQSS